MEKHESTSPLDVYHLMNRNVVSCHGDTSILEVAQLLRDQKVGCVVVIKQYSDGVRPIGIITDRDLSSKILADNVDPTAITAMDVMSSPPISVREKNSIAEAINLMRDHRIKRLTVVDLRGQLAGLISADDIFFAMASDFHELASSLAGLLKHAAPRITSIE